MNATLLRLILVSFLAVSYLLAILYLSRRKMPKQTYVFWGIFALFLPAFGPFFLIAYRPGKLAHRERNRLKPRPKRRQIFPS